MLIWFLTTCGQATDEQSQQTNAVTYIQNLLELKDRFDSFLSLSFGNDKFFKQVVITHVSDSLFIAMHWVFIHIHVHQCV